LACLWLTALLALLLCFLQFFLERPSSLLNPRPLKPIENEVLDAAARMIGVAAKLDNAPEWSVSIANERQETLARTFLEKHGLTAGASLFYDFYFAAVTYNNSDGNSIVITAAMSPLVRRNGQMCAFIAKVTGDVRKYLANTNEQLAVGLKRDEKATERCMKRLVDNFLGACAANSLNYSDGKSAEELIEPLRVTCELASMADGMSKVRSARTCHGCLSAGLRPGHPPPNAQPTPPQKS